MKKHLWELDCKYGTRIEVTRSIF